MARQIYVTAQIEIPRPPNFLRYGNGGLIQVGDIADEDLAKIGDAWVAALVERAKEQRAAARENRALQGS